jgi:PAS domain S-box-containing protein
VSRLLRPWLAIGLGAAGLAGVDIALALASHHDKQHIVNAVFVPLIGLSFVAAGLLAWTRRPDNGTGRLITAVGLLWMTNGLFDANNRWVYTVATLFGSLFLAAFVHLVLAYPRGKLVTAQERRVIGWLYFVAWLASVLPSLFDPGGATNCDGCPPSKLLITPSKSAAQAIGNVFTIFGLVIFLGVAFLLVRRWRRSTKPARRIVGPVYLSAGVTLALVALTFATDFASNTINEAIGAVAFSSFALVPFFFLAGLLRIRMQRASVARLLLDVPEHPTPEDAEAGFRRALHDPTLRLLPWLESGNRYVDTQGSTVSQLPHDYARRTIVIEDAGRPLGAIVHDAALRHEPELLEEVVGVARLALEQDRGQQALRRSEAHNRALIEALPDLIFHLSRDGTYLSYAGDAADLVVPPEQLIGAHVRDVLPEPIAEAFLRCLAGSLDDGLQSIEYTLELEGVERDFEARMVPSGDDEVIVIVRDFTERRRLEDELQERIEEIEREQQFTRTVVDTAPVVFVVLDTDGRILRFNRTGERLFGYPDDDTVRGRLFWDVFIPPEHHELAYAMLIRLQFGERLIEAEGTWVAYDGRRYVMDCFARPVVDGQGRDRYLVGAVDITERKHHEAEVKASRARIVEATDETRRKLERNLHDGAQQRLVSLSLALRRAQSKVYDDPAAAEQVLAGAAEELTQALAELRELARGIHPAVLSDRGLGPALEALADRAPVPVELSADLDERLPGPVEAAAYYVVAEALTNVAKYADASSVRVTAARENGRVVVEVADDGVGGADPLLGSGLRGLSDRVEALDGHLQVESAAGAGTTLRAEIPLVEAS